MRRRDPGADRYPIPYLLEVRERGWRHLWWDAGALLANLLAAADAHGVPAQIMAGFPGAAVAALVGIDGVDECPSSWCASAAVSYASLRPMRSSPSPRGPIRWPVACCASRSSSTLTRTPLDLDAVAGWQQAARRSPSRHRRWSNPLPTATLTTGSKTSSARRLTRLFRRQRAPSPLLEWGLAAAARPCPWPAPAGTLLEHLVSVHDVADAEPGGYRYTPPVGSRPHPQRRSPRRRYPPVP